MQSFTPPPSTTCPSLTTCPSPLLFKYTPTPSLSPSKSKPKNPISSFLFQLSTMADTHQQPQHYGGAQHYGGHPGGATDTIKSMLPERGPSASQVVAVVTLFPLGGLLLILAGLTLTGTVIGLAVCTPIFILFSPILVPAALTIGLAMTGFLTSGAFGLTGMSSMAWIINYLRQVMGKIVHQVGEKVQQMPEHMEGAKRRLQDTTGPMGQRLKETGGQVQRGTHEAGRTKGAGTE